MNGRRSGRVELAALVAGITGGAVVAVVVWFMLPTRERGAEADSLATRLGTPTNELADVQAALTRLEQRLAGIDAGVRSAPRTSERAEVMMPEEREADATRPSETEELHEDLRQLAARVDVLALAWRERSQRTFELPTLDQVHAARRDVDWKWIAGLADLFLKDEDAAQERVRLMTFDQLLKRAGVPTGIRHDDGSWMYLKPEGLDAQWRGVYFGFVGDCVSWVRTDM